MPFAKLEKSQIYYEVHGDKQPLVLLAGLGRDHTQWLDFIEPLKSHFKLILIDNPPSGSSSWKKKTLTIQDMAESVIAVLDALNLKKIHLLGHSMGGFIAQAVAAFYPERVDHLALFGAGALPSKVSFLTSEIVADLKKHNVPIETVMKCLGAISMGMPALLKGEAIEKLIENMQKTPHPMKDSDQLLQIKACMMQDSRGYLPKIKAKTLICTGEEDVFAPPEDMEFLYEEIENSEIVLLKGVGHIIQAEAPREFIAIVQSFFAKEPVLT